MVVKMEELVTVGAGFSLSEGTKGKERGATIVRTLVEDNQSGRGAGAGPFPLSMSGSGSILLVKGVTTVLKAFPWHRFCGSLECACPS